MYVIYCFDALWWCNFIVYDLEYHVTTITLMMLQVYVEFSDVASVRTWSFDVLLSVIQFTRYCTGGVVMDLYIP